MIKNERFSVQKGSRRHNRFYLLIITAVIVATAAGGWITWSQYQDQSPARLDAQLTAVVQQNGLSPIAAGPDFSAEKVALGRDLFFDKELSGSRDIACATCHHPDHSSNDELNLSVGVGGQGLGYERARGEARPFIPRNAPEIFNRGAPEWRTMFWDGRVHVLDDGTIVTPADEDLPAGLDNIVAVQAMFPVTSRDEMRGRKGDLDVHGRVNTLAALNDRDFEEIWTAVMDRILAVPAYVEQFAAVYPEVPPEDLHYLHAANALGAFQIEAFSFDDSSWDRYLAGDSAALSPAQKRGALLFYGRAQCATCHSGPLMTDQEYYNILVPQIGPGHRDSAGYDIGRARVTDKETDAFAFRTPPLRNVTMTGPWMHNGAYGSLEETVRHHIDPLAAIQAYDTGQLVQQDLNETFRNDISTVLIMSETLSPEIAVVPELSDEEIGDLIAFMNALTSPESQDLAHLVPETVPSGLPVTP